MAKSCQGEPILRLLLWWKGAVMRNWAEGVVAGMWNWVEARNLKEAVLTIKRIDDKREKEVLSILPKFLAVYSIWKKEREADVRDVMILDGESWVPHHQMELPSWEQGIMGTKKGGLFKREVTILGCREFKADVSQKVEWHTHPGLPGTLLGLALKIQSSGKTRTECHPPRNPVSNGEFVSCCCCTKKTPTGWLDTTEISSFTVL